jgi:hypothetical protein
LSKVITGDESWTYEMSLRQSNNPPSGKSKVTETEEGGTGGKQSQKYVYYFL